MWATARSRVNKEETPSESISKSQDDVEGLQ